MYKVIQLTYDLDDVYKNLLYNSNKIIILRVDDLLYFNNKRYDINMVNQIINHLTNIHYIVIIKSSLTLFSLDIINNAMFKLVFDSTYYNQNISREDSLHKLNKNTYKDIFDVIKFLIG